MKLFRSFATALAFAAAIATAQPVHAGPDGLTEEESLGLFLLGAIVLMGIASSANQARDRQATQPNDRDRGRDNDRDYDRWNPYHQNWLDSNLPAPYQSKRVKYYTRDDLDSARVTCKEIGGAWDAVTTSWRGQTERIRACVDRDGRWTR